MTKQRTVEQAQCSTCGAPILWVETTDKKRMPLDAAAERRVMVVQGPGGPVGHVVVCYRSHFATCPQAAEHRKPKAEKGADGAEYVDAERAAIQGEPTAAFQRRGDQP